VSVLPVFPPTLGHQVRGSGLGAALKISPTRPSDHRLLGLPMRLNGLPRLTRSGSPATPMGPREGRRLGPGLYAATTTPGLALTNRRNAHPQV